MLLYGKEMSLFGLSELVFTVYKTNIKNSTLLPEQQYSQSYSRVDLDSLYQWALF